MRVIDRPTTFGRLLDLSLDEISHYGSDTLQVPPRIEELLDDVEGHGTPRARRRRRGQARGPLVTTPGGGTPADDDWTGHERARGRRGGGGGGGGQAPSKDALPGPFSTKLRIPVARSFVAKSPGEQHPLDLESGLEVDLQAPVDRLLGRAEGVVRVHRRTAAIIERAVS